MRFLIEVTLSDDGRDAEANAIADSLLEYLCKDTDVLEIESYDSCEPMEEESS